MALEIKIPSPGESITEVELASWFVDDGALVNKNQEVGEIESEKATLPLIAEQAGQLKILIAQGETILVGTVVATIDTSVEVAKIVEETKTVEKPKAMEKPTEEAVKTPEKQAKAVKSTPVAREIMEQENLSVDDIINGLRKITASDVKKVMQHSTIEPHPTPKEITRNVEKKKVSQLRRKISERLVAVKNETAMLTTFNEADMSAIMAIRKKYQESFVQAHGIKLGFMSFFTKAICEALQLYPSVNSYLDGDEVVSPAYCDVAIAVQTDKGLMVPVLRNAETLGLAEIEKGISDLAGRARKARLGIEEMTGGTFTISNGGIYGSMLSTPILNPPQSGILGMHNIIERPVAINGKVEVRPMMYIALSYDHRVIDGKDSVSFLKAVKEFIEDPSRMLFGAGSAEEHLLEI
ncbi:MAG: 2-oxoglutarate dehydrogenase complex dihydrolipoyllysine-residue succinyltransferase [Bacteroides sp.]|nr:2-oxoglutarate dehydrogenase complex dihydrolipoyllysine-residue succinyltransferase [Bacteroides sp.]